MERIYKCDPIACINSASTKRYILIVLSIVCVVVIALEIPTRDSKGNIYTATLVDTLEKHCYKAQDSIIAERRYTISRAPHNKRHTVLIHAVYSCGPVASCNTSECSVPIEGKNTVYVSGWIGDRSRLVSADDYTLMLFLVMTKYILALFVVAILVCGTLLYLKERYYTPRFSSTISDSTLI